jgi:UDP-glucuronate 4-epimerase
MRLLVTGSAGFIGARTCLALLDRGVPVVGLDSLSDYYDPALKHARLGLLESHPQFTFHHADVTDPAALGAAWDAAQPTHVIHLAAQAGAGASITNPARTVQANLVGFANILEACRQRDIQHLVYASSSSVYGLDRALPFSERTGGDHPITPYGATKRANELMAHSHAHLFNLPCTGLRFFTVYGPWGRPDMVLSKWTAAILRGEPIRVFNQGRSTRDFTYIDDVAEAIVRVAGRPASRSPDFDPSDPDPATSSAPFRVYNVACGQSVPLMHYIQVLEECLGRKAVLRMEPIQPGDVPDTSADVSALSHDLGFTPSTPVEVGIPRFVEWYRSYHRV